MIKKTISELRRIVALASAVGAFIGGVSVFNLIRKGMSLGLSPVISALIQAYEWLFHHVIFDTLFWWIAVTVPEFAKDIFALWLVGYGVVLRIIVRLVNILRADYSGSSSEYIFGFLVRISGLQRIIGLKDFDVRVIVERIDGSLLLKRYIEFGKSGKISEYMFYFAALFSWPIMYANLIAGDYRIVKNRLRKDRQPSLQPDNGEEGSFRFPFKRKHKTDFQSTLQTLTIAAVVLFLLLINAGLLTIS